jgi:hypothetical protein
MPTSEQSNMPPLTSEKLKLGKDRSRFWSSVQQQLRRRHRKNHRFGKSVDLRALTLAEEDESSTPPGIEPPGPLLLGQYAKCLGGTYLIISVSSTRHSICGLRFEAYDPQTGDSRVLFADVTQELSPPDDNHLQVDPVLDAIEEKQKDLVRELAVAVDYYPMVGEVPPAVVKVGVEGLLDYFRHQPPAGIRHFTQQMEQILNVYGTPPPSPPVDTDQRPTEISSSPMPDQEDMSERLLAMCKCMGNGLQQHRPPQRLGRREAQLQEQAQWGLQLRGFCMAVTHVVLTDAQAGVSQCSVQGSEATKARRIREKQRAYDESLRPQQLLIPNDRQKPVVPFQLEPGFESPEVSESELICGIATTMGYIEFFQTGQFEVEQLPDDTDGVEPNIRCRTHLYCAGLASVGFEHQEDEMEGYYLGDHPQPPPFSARWMFESDRGFNQTPGEKLCCTKFC